MILHWPQLAWIVLAMVSLGCDLAKHGELRTGRHSFGWSLIGTAIVAVILSAGGFFG